MRDIADGDDKIVTVVGRFVEIQPHGNSQKWKAFGAMDPSTCSAVINFAVPGKPNPPPCKLTMTWWDNNRPVTGATDKLAVEFTDPDDACKFGDPGAPLNRWVAVTGSPYVHSPAVDNAGGRPFR